MKENESLTMRSQEPKWPKRVILVNFAYGYSKKNCIWGSQCAEKSCVHMSITYTFWCFSPSKRGISARKYLFTKLIRSVAANFGKLWIQFYPCRLDSTWQRVASKFKCTWTKKLREKSDLILDDIESILCHLISNFSDFRIFYIVM